MHCFDPIFCPGDGYGNPDAFGVSGHGPALSYRDHGNGTFTDNYTGLMWEEKDDTGDIHDGSNTYKWSSSGTAPDGTLFTDFLNTLNNTCSDETTPCTTNRNCKGIGNGLCGFDGYRNWRIPNVKELESIVDYSKSDPAYSGPDKAYTASPGYWSATTLAGNAINAWGVDFLNGDVGNLGKSSPNSARAVRQDGWASLPMARLQAYVGEPIGGESDNF